MPAQTARRAAAADAAGSAAPRASTAPPSRRRRGGASRARRAGSTPSTTTAASASPAAASKATSQPSSISTRSRSVPTTPSTSRSCSAPARARAWSSAEARASARAAHVSRATSADWRARSPALTASSASARRCSAAASSTTRGSSSASAASHSPRRRSASAVSRSRRAARSAWRWPSRASSATDRSTVGQQETQLAAHLGRRTRRRRRRAVVVVAHRLAVGGQHRLVGLHLALDRLERGPGVAHLGRARPAAAPRRPRGWRPCSCRAGDRRRARWPGAARSRPRPGRGPAPGAGSTRPTASARSVPPMAVSRASAASTSVSSRASVARSSRSVVAVAVWLAASDVSLAWSAVISRPARNRRRPSSSATRSPWRRAASAWRSSGRSWRRTSRRRSCSRSRLPSVASSRRSAFSLRLRNFRTPAASSMMSRRSSGRALSTASIWPWLTITCCWRPTPRVGQQLLDVEQAAGHAVDGVLALAGAEERAGERHLGELDGQEAGRVVDREAHLGPAEGGALVGAGEDDVVHLLAAHRRRGLRAEHPARWRRPRWTCPLPFGPTTTVTPGSSSSVVASAKDLKPLRVSDRRNTSEQP